MKILIIVTHLLGTGHLSRAMVLARAQTAAGHSVRIISGGMPAPHLRTGGAGITQLPPVRSDGVNFTRLLDSGGREASPALMAERRDTAVAVLREMTPDVVITELFPFGRRILTPEFRAILEAAAGLRPRPVICASVRDILAPPSKPAKAEAAEAIIAAFYDAVLVHSDPAVAPLDASWPVTDRLRTKLKYTGFVANPPAGPHPDAAGDGEVIVSAGGGDVGDALFAAALDAANQSPDIRWRVLAGGPDAKEKCADLTARAPGNVTVEPVRSDFRRMLYHARASVSMCGYNTALDILQAGTPAVFVPFDAGGEVEQSLRARALAKLDGIGIVAASGMTGGQLLQALRAVLDAPPRPQRNRGLDGSARTVELLEALVGSSRDED